eukprot:g6614.t1
MGIHVTKLLLLLYAVGATLPLESHFSGLQAAHLRKAFSPADWHPTQLAYGDGRGTTSPVARAALAAGATTVSPADFGGDATGTSDSAPAFRAAVAALQLLCRSDSNATTARLDCGGAVLDLRGGWYAVSEPVRIPAPMSNLWVRGGSIVARPEFAAARPSEDFLLVLGAGAGAGAGSGRSSNVGVQQLTLDAKKVAGGCLFVDGAQFSTVGPGLMLLGFSSYGIEAAGSGGTVVQGVFAGEWPVSDPRGHDLSLLAGTAVHFAPPQHDGFVTNTIIWSARVGVHLHGAAQQLGGVHPWNYVAHPADGHQTSAVDGAGLGIVVASAGARVENCYLDTVPLVLNVTGGAGHTLVSGNLFLKNASVLLSAPRWARPSARTGVTGITVTDNVFSCKASAQFGACEAGAVLLDETGSRFGGDIADVRVDGNEVDADAGYRATRARKALAVRNATGATLDFSGSLLFPAAALRNGSAACTLREGPPVAHAVRTDDPRAPGAVPLALRVQFDRRWSGVVECTVDQSARSRCAL